MAKAQGFWAGLGEVLTNVATHVSSPGYRAKTKVSELKQKLDQLDREVRELRNQAQYAHNKSDNFFDNKPIDADLTVSEAKRLLGDLESDIDRMIRDAYESK